MKTLKLLALTVCVAGLLVGCASNKACCGNETATAACGMKCCTDSKATCATCATCSKKK